MKGKGAEYAACIKTHARRLGFSGCGISSATFLENDARVLESWIKSGMHGSMRFMENHFEKRVDPRKLLKGARSVISVLHNYYPPVRQKNPDAPVLSKYSYGRDYHFILKDKLKRLLGFIKDHIGDVNGRAFVDSAPVLERAWAVRSGLGWRGRNTNLLTREGSFFFIGELIVDIELPPDTPVREQCGDCRLCLDACPTGALVAPYTLDAGKCISYLTVEYKGELPSEIKGKMFNRVFGCDICQDVCPWNKKTAAHNDPLLEPDPRVIEMTSEDWYGMGEEFFNRVFRNSTLQRCGYQHLKRNLQFLSK